MRKSLGNKRNEMTTEQIDEITKIYGDFVENKISKIYENEYFGYRKVTVLQPELDKNGNVVRDKKGNPIPNKDLTDTETIPLTENVEDYINREVIPYAPNAWVDDSKTKLGYEIAFTKYFYKYKAPRNSKDILNEIINLDEKQELILRELKNEL